MSAESDTAEEMFAKQAWLNYFNKYLYASGTISESEYKKMIDKISAVCKVKSRK